MKKYIKNIGIDFMILIMEIYLFCLGRSLLDKPYNVDFSLNSVDDIINIIFNSKLYLNDNLRMWFIAAFVLFIFIYINLYMSQSLESPGYRSLKLYRYGKTEYLKLCKRKSSLANLKAIALLFIGVLLIIAMLSFEGINISFDRYQLLVITIQFIKIFLIMELFGSLNIYFLLRKNYNYVLIFSMIFLFLQFLLESYINMLNIYTYKNITQKIIYIVIFIFLNVIVNFWCIWYAKKKSMC